MKPNTEEKQRPSVLQFMTLFSRAAEAPGCPEKNLILAVIRQALTDVLGGATRWKGKRKYPAGRHGGMAFFANGSYRVYCELIGLNLDWVGEVLRDYAGIQCEGIA